MTLDAFKKKDLPDKPGVYFFLGKNKEILYIGKATSLRSRVRSYFTQDLLETRSTLIEKMVREAKTIDWKETDSVLEAILLEADLIKKFQPHFNSKVKDDKSYNTVVITKEAFPRVLIVRKYDLDRVFPGWSEGDFARTVGVDRLDFSPETVYGPFPQGTSLRNVLKIVRKIFPFRDTCEVGQAKPCFNRQIGLCPGVCTQEITSKEYRRTIQNIKLFFGGRKKTLLAKLEREMRAYAKVREFEKAEHVKRTLFALRHIQDVALMRREQAVGAGFRIEGYDIAHLSGTHTVGVMTVVEDGFLKKSDYRKFTIQETEGVNDPKGLSEVLRRRLGHVEWTFPNLIVVDGNAIQKNAAEEVLRLQNLAIPVVSVVKDERHRARQIVGDEALIHAHKDAILLANAEAHRFGVAFHRARRGKHMF